MLTKETILNLPLNTPGLFGAKDLSGHWIWITHMVAELFHYSSAKDLIGVRDHDVGPIKDFAEQYITNDKVVISRNGGAFIEPFGQYNGNVIQGICTKIPYYDEQNTIAGIYWSAALIGSDSIYHLINSIQQSLTPIYGNNRPQLQVASKTLKYQLTTREEEVLFYTLRGKSSKSVAQCLNLSPRTIETYLENIKIKFSCHSKQQLIDAAIAEGYMAMVPSTILQ